MGFIAQSVSTKELFYSKGANKLADHIGINATTVTRNAKKDFTEKVYNGFIFAKTTELLNLSRGLPFKRTKSRF